MSLEDLLFPEVSRSGGNVRNPFEKWYGTGPLRGNISAESRSFLVKNVGRTLQVMATLTPNQFLQFYPNLHSRVLAERSTMSWEHGGDGIYRSGANTTALSRSTEFHLPFVGYAVLALLTLLVFFGVFFYFIFLQASNSSSRSNSGTSSEWYYDIDREANNNGRNERNSLFSPFEMEHQEETERCHMFRSPRTFFTVLARAALNMWQKVVGRTSALGNRVIQRSPYYSAPADYD